MEGIWATPRQKLRKRRRPKLFFETHLVLVSNHLHPDRHRVFVAGDRRRLQVDALVEDHGGEVREHADKHPVHKSDKLTLFTTKQNTSFTVTSVQGKRNNAFLLL